MSNVKWTIWRKIFSATFGADPDTAAPHLGEVRRHGLQEVGGEAQLWPLVLDSGQQRHRDIRQVVAKGGYGHLLLIFIGFLSFFRYLTRY